jgi:transketolase
LRTSFINTLSELAAADERVWLLTGDLGYSVLETYYGRYPDRYVNVGVAEQDLTGIAAGLATCGKIVFTYSIANFPTLRCVEQIRNDVCYHNLPVKIVSVGGGFAYGPQGYTHHGLEELAILRTLPNMTVIAPGDPVEADLATRAALNIPGPCYLRLGKAREPVVHPQPPPFALGKAIQMRDGSDVTLISTGGMLEYVVQTAERLAAEHRIAARVLSMHTLKPLDEAAVQAAARQTGGIVTVEEHSVIGGLGSAVADVIAALDEPHGPFRKYGVPDHLDRPIGSQTYLRALSGDLVEIVCGMLRGKPR